MTGREAAAALFGEEAVVRALAAEADPVTGALAEEVRRRADPPGAFRAWALAQPWPKFCAVVRIVAGVTREELMSGDAE